MLYRVLRHAADEGGGVTGGTFAIGAEPLRVAPDIQSQTPIIVIDDEAAVGLAEITIIDGACSRPCSEPRSRNRPRAASSAVDHHQRNRQRIAKRDGASAHGVGDDLVRFRQLFRRLDVG